MLVSRAVKIVGGAVGYVDVPNNAKLIAVGNNGLSAGSIATIIIDVPGEPDITMNINGRYFMPSVPLILGPGSRIGIKNGASNDYIYSVLFDIE